METTTNPYIEVNKKEKKQSKIKRGHTAATPLLLLSRRFFVSRDSLANESEKNKCTEVYPPPFYWHAARFWISREIERADFSGRRSYKKSSIISMYTSTIASSICHRCYIYQIIKAAHTAGSLAFKGI